MFIGILQVVLLIIHRKCTAKLSFYYIHVCLFKEASSVLRIRNKFYDSAYIIINDMLKLQ